MRYFKTNEDEFLYFKWDGEKLWFRGDLRTGQWLTDSTLTLETLNQYYVKFPDETGTFEPGDPFFAYETDENWNRL